MSHPYFDIAFTDKVRALQERSGSRQAYQSAGDRRSGEQLLSDQEAGFLAAADHFFMASVSETGWPYVQHRGGPAGFLRVLDEKTIAFADFGGNRQFISTGNLQGDDRVALFFMDWVNKRRLKLMGRARIVDAADDVALARTLSHPDYPAKVERLFVIDVLAFDWNCPQHITQRYTRASVDAALEDLRQQVAQLQQQLRERTAPLPPG